jgi:hypothetical protein
MKSFQTLLLFLMLTGLAFSAAAQTPQATSVKPVPAVSPSRADVARALIDLPEVDWADQAAKDAGVEAISALKGVVKVIVGDNSHGFHVIYYKGKTSYAQIAEALEAQGYVVEVLAPSNSKK